MAIPLEFGELWFSFAVAGDSELAYTHVACGIDAAVTQGGVDAGYQLWIDNIKTRFPATVTPMGGHLLEQTSSGIRRWEASVTPAAGTAGGSALPINCAILVKKTTASGGRRNRGRMYIPCPAEADTDPAGLYLGAAVTAMNTQLAKLFQGGVINTAFGFVGDLVVLHESGSQTPTVITDLVTQPKIATQRRRMRR